MKIRLAILLIVFTSATANAQTPATANCTYQQCALGLTPVWNGLAVTRGDSEERVAVLGFFLPGDVTGPFAGDREAVTAARDAMALRQIGAVLTDAGIVLTATSVARALFRHDWDKLSSALAIGGGTAVVASAPVQFAADGLLSRAVWLFNRRFSR
jgi:hypothetical protein